MVKLSETIPQERLTRNNSWTCRKILMYRQLWEKLNLQICQWDQMPSYLEVRLNKIMRDSGKLKRAKSLKSKKTILSLKEVLMISLNLKKMRFLTLWESSPLILRWPIRKSTKLLTLWISWEPILTLKISSMSSYLKSSSLCLVKTRET